ncbi:uncharacterized protein BO87DRAFT_27819 [Aspergillus neoniger CBS 115656]|uniref:MADS-box domain-containing protein n=1 Tax=Aspergillus neoniger (strain CBS 115656) TaxID=1448310 RepID=A0A318YMC7_ASPNB|nr:hypothetical protein BO87DRAFT_27819 [Aspergillus neoniger CBS 115656]PYH35376.1 hypothetical protein BO87DRAFT_27819 [Aspergillus neoniger CBS 115656]
MSTESNKQKSSKSPTSPKKMMRQKRDRRRKNLIQKAYEYSKLCDADVCLGIHIRECVQEGNLYIEYFFWATLKHSFTIISLLL